MKNELERRVDDLMTKAFSAEGEEKLAYLEEAAQVADAGKSVELGIYVREQIVETATFSGYNEKSLIAFNWMLLQWDRDPEKFEDVEHTLLWQYKWIGEHLTEFPQISAEQIAQVHDDMERRYRKAELSLKPVHKLRFSAALDMGRLEEAEREYALWRATDGDYASDCKACDLDECVGYLVQTGRIDSALKEARPLLKGRMMCQEVPGITHSRWLVPLLRAGHVEQAAASQDKSHRQMRQSRSFLNYLAQHLLFFSLTGHSTRAVKLIESRLGWAMQTRNGHHRFHFLRAAYVALARLAATGKKQVRIRMPQEFGERSEDDRYETAALAARLKADAAELAGAFDRRNGTKAYARILGEGEELIRLQAIELPKKKQASPKGAS